MAPKKGRRKNNKKSVIKESEYKCELCESRDPDKPIVACDICNKWHHFSCVNIVSISESDPWVCFKCESAKKENVADPKYTCKLCYNADDDRMITCEECVDKYHFACTNMKMYDVRQKWRCPTCTIRYQNKSRNVELRASIASEHTKQAQSINQSHCSQGSKRSIQMELDYLEELRELNERWDREREINERQYLQQKYRILRREEDFYERRSNIDRQQDTEAWVDNTIKEQPQRLDSECMVRMNRNRPCEQNQYTVPNKAEGYDQVEQDRANKIKDLKKLTVSSPHHTEQNHRFQMNNYQENVDVIPPRFQEPAPYGPDQNRSINKTNKLETGLTTGQIASRHVVRFKLPNFFGDPLEWTSWYTSYEDTTKLCGYTDGENLLRLKECLQGKAKEAVKHRLLSPSSVPQIIKTLKMLYGRADLIVSTLLKTVRDIQAPKPDKLESLVDYAMEVNSISATIESAQLHYHLSNPTLIQELVEKLPTHTKIEWAKFKAREPTVTLKLLADWLYNLAEIVCTVTVPTISKQEINMDKKMRKGSERINTHQLDKEFSTEQNLMEIAKPEPKITSTYLCKLCSKNCPEVSQCSTFKSYNTNQRWKAVNSYKLCRKCLRRHNGFCRLTKQCGIDGCTYKHHPLLHNDKNTKATILAEDNKNLKEVTALVRANHHLATIANILYRIVPVILYNGDISVSTYAYLDEGSSGTLIEEALYKKLQLEGAPERLCLLWTGNIHRIEEQSHRVDIEISGQDTFTTRYILKGVRTVKNLGLPMQTINMDELIKKFSYLNGIPLIDYEDKTPTILIGLPHIKICTQSKIIQRGEDEPVASKSRIGWSLYGPTRQYNDENMQALNTHRVVICKTDQEGDEQLHRLVKEYFSLDSFGVKINNNFNHQSKEEERAVNILQNKTNRKNGRFETALLWRYDSFKLPDSYPMAKRRLICLEKSKPNLIPVISATIADYINKGYVNKLSKEEISIERERIGYLPIFTITHAKKPEKIRMVFDAAAKTNGISLNDMLLKGPDQTNLLVDILRRFRENPIAVCADISEMYHQIEICDEDKHVQRFLWRDGNIEKEPDIYVLNVMTFGATCSPSSAQYVKNLNADGFRAELPRAVEAIVLNTYVDDMMESTRTEDDAIRLVREVQQIHQHGGFQIGKFLSNSMKVLEALDVPETMEEKNIVTNSNQNIERVLGMFWNTKTDCFMFSLKFTKINEEVRTGKRYPTKREILKTLMSIFDPLGLLTHFLIRLKILLQDVWRSKLEWDEEISSEDQKEAWDTWFKILPNVEKLSIPRYYSPMLTEESLNELHVFVDASMNAFSAVGYLRIENQGQIKCVLIGSKTRVAPLKYISIPRLELQSAVLGTRFLQSIEKSQKFKINRRYLWTDSKTVISWIRSDHRKYQQFVAHRIGEILENSDQNEWRWLPGNENVADEATKWTKPPSFEYMKRWYSGPEFLYLPEDQWPKEDIQIESNTSEEMKIYHLYQLTALTHIVDPNRFSDWNKMVKAVAYSILFIKILRAKIKKEKLPHTIITKEEYIKSQSIIFQQAQCENYPDEMMILRRNQHLAATEKQTISNSSSLIKCSPYLDETGVLRLRGRIDISKDVSMDFKRPIILPKKNRITFLLIDCYHKIFLHRNHETALNEIKQKFFIPELRVQLKLVRKNCQYCKIRDAKPQPPEMGNLPFARLALGFRAFTYTGIDYFGPYLIVDGRTNKKRWGVLFTCLTTRAIHIEIASTMNTDSCIQCIRNFIARRGRPTEFYSDNGGNFEGADNELSKVKKEIDIEKMANEFTSCYTTWNFNPPLGQHQGGCWERLIRSVKTCLNDVIPTIHKPTDEQFKNLLVEIEFIINSRPLTFISLEKDTDEALTPNHFLLGSSDGSKPIVPMELSGPNLRSKWRENQRLADLFWKRFIREYLPTLTRKTKWFKTVEPLKINDLVIMLDEEGPRNNYPKARIIEVITGSNGQVRKARVQKADGIILLRPAHKLAKLDIVPK